jgi:hypothetical protein
VRPWLEASGIFFGVVAGVGGLCYLITKYPEAAAITLVGFGCAVGVWFVRQYR